MGKFYVFVDNPDIEEFRGCSAVNEIIPKQRLRYPTIDIDSKTPSLTEILSYFHGIVDSVNDVLVFETRGGYHVLLKTIPIDFEEHQSLLKKIAADKPAWNVDTRAGLYSIKLPGTRSAKQGSVDKRLIYPVGFTSTLLSCPVSVQSCYEEITDDDFISGPIDDNLNAEQIQQISTLLTGQPDQITGITNQTSNMISLGRVPGSFCKICQRRHGYNEIGGYVEGKAIDAFVVVHSDCYVVGCFRNPGKKINVLCEKFEDENVSTRNDYLRYLKHLRSYKYRRGDYRGEFPTRIPDVTYREAPIHERGLGCKVIYNDDYMDCSPCGMGKSEAAWKSIRSDQSTLHISYRKSFTDKTASDYKLERYNDINGEIVYKYGVPRKVITQIESIVRVVGIPDVIILDEWHGILRQMRSAAINSSRGKSIWDKFVGLVSAARRVIVLDALANNDDLELFRKYLNRSEMRLICNEYQIDHGKRFIVEQSHEKNLVKLLLTLHEGNNVVVFTHNKRHGNYSVEELAKLLQRLHYRVKYYHADVNTAERQWDFSNIPTAFNEVQVVIFNHTVEAGISIVNERFKHLFVFSEETGSVEATKQALHRFRNVNEIHYSVAHKRVTALPLTRSDIMEAIETRERDCSSRELLFRSPNFDDLHTGYGHAFISVVLDENNSKCYFTGRLVALMKQSGYSVEWILPDEYELWLAAENKKKNQKISTEIIDNSDSVDDFLKSSVGERIAAAGNNNEPLNEIVANITGETDKSPRIKYHRYDPDERLEPYRKKLMYLNAVFQKDVSKLNTDLIEQLNKNVSKMQKHQRVMVDKLNNGDSIISQRCRSDRITPRQQLEIIRDVLDILELPDVVPVRLDVKSVQVRRAELVKNISKMLAKPDRLEKYNTLMKYFVEIFPGAYFRKGTLSVKNIIEKIKLIYKEFGGSLESDNKINASRGNYTLYYPDWPRSGFLDNKDWLNENTSEVGPAGKDVIAVDEHTTMLKFHVWSVNGWFSRYDGSD